MSDKDSKSKDTRSTIVVKTPKAQKSKFVKAAQLSDSPNLETWILNACDKEAQKEFDNPNHNFQWIDLKRE